MNFFLLKYKLYPLNLSELYHIYPRKIIVFVILIFKIFCQFSPSNFYFANKHIKINDEFKKNANF